MFADFADRAAEVEQDDLHALMERVAAGLIPYESHGYLLTDDHAPVEKLGMAVMDDLIRNELKYYKDILKEEGIRGLIASVQ